MSFDLNIPFWAIFYCTFLMANGAMTVVISPDRSAKYIFGETLSTLLAISFFFMYFGTIKTPSTLILSLILFFILYQEIWVNKELYKQMVFDNIPEHERSKMFNILAVLLLVFLSPFIYVVFSLFDRL